MKDTTIAVDLAKNVFEIAISGEAGKVSKQLRVSRPKLVSFFAKQSAATVLLEACGSAHFWARTFPKVGTRRRPAPTSPREGPIDAGARTTAPTPKRCSRPTGTRRFFPCPLSPCTSTASPRSIACAQDGSPHGPHASMPYAGSCANSDSSSQRALTSSCPALFELVEDADSDLPDVLRSHLRDACSEIRELKDKCAGIEHELKALTKQLPEVQRLLAIPGIGLLTATAIVGFVGDLRRLPIGAPLLELPRPSSQGKLQWRHSPPRTHHQAWRLLPPYAPHPGRARRAPRGERQ